MPTGYPKSGINVGRFLPGHSISQKTRIKISQALKKIDGSWRFKVGHIMPQNVREKISIALKGEKKPPRSKEHKRRLSESHLGLPSWNKGKKGFLAGPKHYNWQGGITDEMLKIRNSFEYKEWRKIVFRRDNYTCQECGTRGVKIHADHVLPFALFPSDRLKIENGRTLCVPCHKKTFSFAKRKRDYALFKLPN